MQSLPPIGRALKHWRRLRGQSQLDLANAAGVSARHLSFIESGRARPRESVVLRLAAALNLPLRDRNVMLEAAGFAPAYRHTPLTSDALAPFRQVVERILRCHEPFPALVLDRFWNVLDMNDVAARLFPSLRNAAGKDALAIFFAPGPIRDAIENFGEVAWSGLERLRIDAAESGYPGVLTTLTEQVERWLSDVPRPSADPVHMGLLACPTFRIGGRRIRTVTTLTTFSRVDDVTLQELRIEQIFPADAESEAFFREQQLPQHRSA
jgi:transcriptional regulator with XRE-family HTH domain